MISKFKNKIMKSFILFFIVIFSVFLVNYKNIFNRSINKISYVYDTSLMSGSCTVTFIDTFNETETIKTVEYGNPIYDIPNVYGDSTYSFLSWQLDEIDFNFDTPITNDITLKSKFVKVSFTLNEAYEIRNNISELSYITNLIITENDNLEYVSIINKLTNLKVLRISNVSIDDISFLNNINFSSNTIIIFESDFKDKINLEKINNSTITDIAFSFVEIENFEMIKKLTNLKKISLSCLIPSQINGSAFSGLDKLNEIKIRATYIEDYKTFFENINKLVNLKRLYIYESNIQNRDIQYLNNDYITELSLGETPISDISFINNLDSLEMVDLPGHVTDFSPLYKNNTLKYVWWDSFTEYNVTKELTDYLDSKNIVHYNYYPEIKSTIDNLIKNANINSNDSDLVKVLKIRKVMHEYANIGIYNSDYSSILDAIIFDKIGVCAHWSAFTDAILNAAGIENYQTFGYMGVAHVWNTVKSGEKLYVIDIMNSGPLEIDNYLDPSKWSYQSQIYFWRNPYVINSYYYNYAMKMGYEYNFETPYVLNETSGISSVRLYYDFDELDEDINVSSKNLYFYNNTKVESLNFKLIYDYIYKYYDKNGSIKTNGNVANGDYILVTSPSNININHKYEVIVKEKRTYTIKLDSNGSFGKNETIEVIDGEKYPEIFIPERDCYKFVGWHTAKDGGDLITNESIVDIDKVQTLYAHWEFDNKYIITLDNADSVYFNTRYIYDPLNIKYYGDILKIDESVEFIHRNGFSGVAFHDSNNKVASGYYTSKDGGYLVTDFSKVTNMSNHSLYLHMVDKNTKLYNVTIFDGHYNKIYRIEENAKILPLYDPQQENYTFKEWQVNGTKYDFNTPVTSDMILTPLFVVDQYIVTFNSDGGSTVASQTVEYNNNATMPSSPTKTGYTFKEWQLDGVKYNFDSLVTGNITLKAVWTKNSYTVTFNSDGGSTVASQNIEYNNKATIPENPTKTGYTFMEWQLNGETYYFNMSVTENITLKAVWTKNRYTVTFDSGVGIAVASQSIEYNEKVIKPENPTIEGLIFKEWQLDGKPYNFDTLVTNNITLKAVWTVKEYTVTFDSNGGSTVASQNIEYNNKATIPENPTKTGYTFMEWQLNGETYYFNMSVTENITLKAVWTVKEYTVTFDSDGGSTVASQNIEYNNKVIQPSNPTKIGYTFKEWQLDGAKYNFNTVVTGNITLKAVWIKNTYKVTFNSDGGSTVASQNIEYNNKVIQPSNPTKIGYTFKEWQLDGAKYNFNTVVTGNITLKAVWIKNTYKVTFISDGGSTVASQTVEYNTKVTQPSAPTKAGYTFKEWQLDGKTYDFDTAVTGNIALIAVYEKNVEKTLGQLLIEKEYRVNDKLVVGFNVGDTIDNIKQKIGNDVIVESSYSYISTGSKIKRGNESFDVVIKGDVNGDGRVNSGDLLQMRKYLLEEVNLTGCYKEAGIIESIQDIKSLDLLRLRQYLLGEYLFE